MNVIRFMWAVLIGLAIWIIFVIAKSASSTTVPVTHEGLPMIEGAKIRDIVGTQEEGGRVDNEKGD